MGLFDTLSNSAGALFSNLKDAAKDVAEEKKQRKLQFENDVSALLNAEKEQWFVYYKEPYKMASLESKRYSYIARQIIRLYYIEDVYKRHIEKSISDEDKKLRQQLDNDLENIFNHKFMSKYEAREVFETALKKIDLKKIDKNCAKSVYQYYSFAQTFKHNKDLNYHSTDEVLLKALSEHGLANHDKGYWETNVCAPLEAYNHFKKKY